MELKQFVFNILKDVEANMLEPKHGMALIYSKFKTVRGLSGVRITILKDFILEPDSAPIYMFINKDNNGVDIDWSKETATVTRHSQIGRNFINNIDLL